MDIRYNNESVNSNNKDLFYGQIFLMLFKFNWIYFWYVNPRRVLSKIFSSFACFCEHLQSDFRILFLFRQKSRPNFGIFQVLHSLYKNQAFKHIGVKFFHTLYWQSQQKMSNPPHIFVRFKHCHLVFSDSLRKRYFSRISWKYVLSFCVRFDRISRATAVYSMGAIVLKNLFIAAKIRRKSYLLLLKFADWIYYRILWKRSCIALLFFQY